LIGGQRPPRSPWASALDGFRPDRYDVIGATICLIGVGVIMYSPR
jgi:small multidrug resistance family-3 protein